MYNSNNNNNISVLYNTQLEITDKFLFSHLIVLVGGDWENIYRTTKDNQTITDK